MLYLVNSDFVNAVQVIRIGNGDTTTVARVCNVTSGSNKGSDHGVNSVERLEDDTQVVCNYNNRKGSGIADRIREWIIDGINVCRNIDSHQRIP